jgi:hypothetical protein
MAKDAHGNIHYNGLKGKSTAGDNVIRKGKTKTLDLDIHK